MPRKKKLKAVKISKPTKTIKAAKPVKPTNRWRAVAVVFIILFLVNLVFSYSFTVRRIVMKYTEFLRRDEQIHDYEGRDIFEVNGVTYVAYNHPLVIAKIVIDPACATEICNIDSLKRQILTNLTPAIQFTEVAYDSPEGKRLLQETDAKAVPAFVFDDNITLLGNFAFIEDFFIKHGNYYLLKTPPGRHIATPHNEVAHVKGVTENPAVIITEFSSFSCEYCRDLSNVLNSVLKKYPNYVSIRFIHFNRGGHDNDLIQAAECSGEQNAFFEMHDALFANQNNFVNKNGGFNFELLIELAEDLNLDIYMFEECLRDTGRFASRLQNMQMTVADYGIKVSPSVFVNNSFTEGPMTKDQLSERIADIIGPVAKEE